MPFTVWDADSPLEELRFSTSFYLNNANFIRDTTIAIGGTGSNRWFSIYPPPEGSGLAQASITVYDETGLRATAFFRGLSTP